MSEEEELFAFNKADKDALLSSISSTGAESTDRGNGYRFRIMLFKTKSTGIPANNKAMCYYREPTETGWADTTVEYEIWNQHQTVAVGNSKIIIAAPINGRLTVITEFC